MQPCSAALPPLKTTAEAWNSSVSVTIMLYEALRTMVQMKSVVCKTLLLESPEHLECRTQDLKCGEQPIPVDFG